MVAQRKRSHGPGARLQALLFLDQEERSIQQTKRIATDTAVDRQTIVTLETLHGRFRLAAKNSVQDAILGGFRHGEAEVDQRALNNFHALAICSRLQRRLVLGRVLEIGIAAKSRR